MSMTVDTLALAQNYAVLREKIGDFYCVLKCNAYGHGAVRCAKALYSAGARRFAVFSLDEACALRPYVGSSETLILGRTPVRDLSYVSEKGFTQTVFSEEYAGEVSSFSGRLKLHIKVDTGMNRSGFSPDSERIFSSLRDVKDGVLGIYTHFPSADAPDIYDTEKRLSVFLNVATEAERLFGTPLIKHAAASASAVRLPSARLDLCRIGLILYGVMPDNTFVSGLTPIMSLCGRAVSVRRVKSGETVGYGGAYLCKNDSVIATVDVGYAGGVRRSLAGRFSVSVGGHRAPLVAVCMDRCMIDVSELFDNGITVNIGDTVTFFGSELSINDVARAADTVSYEILTGAGLKRTDLV